MSRIDGMILVLANSNRVK